MQALGAAPLGSPCAQDGPHFSPHLAAVPHGVCGLWGNTLISPSLYLLNRLFAGLLACFCWLCGNSALAQSNAETIVVTGSREPTALARVAADVVLITSDTLRASSADTLADVLRREAGLQLSRNGGPGQNAGLLIRGASSGQTVVLVDGVRVGSATTGIAGLEGLALHNISRIEVLRGPGSSLYGADAVGGVVQIFTQRGEGSPRAQAHMAVGGYSSREAAFSGALQAGAWDAAAVLSEERSNGVSALRPGDLFGNHNPDADGYRLTSAQAQVGFTPLAGQRVGLLVLRTRLNAQYDGSDYLPPSYAQDNSADFRTRLNTAVSALDWRLNMAAGWSGSVRAARSSDEVSAGGRAPNRFDTEQDQFSGQVVAPLAALGQLLLALEHNTIKANSDLYLAGVQRRNEAAVLAWSGSAELWSWQADVRRDDNSDFGAVTTGRLGGAWGFAPGWRLRVLGGSTFRAPSFNDLYYPGYGVATLRPEKGRSVEAGVSYQTSNGTAAATVYNNRLNDLIGYSGNPARCPSGPDYAFGCAANIARARLQGLTLSTAQHWGAFSLKAQADWLQAHDRESGQRLQRRAAQQARVGVTWAFAAGSVGADVLHLGDRLDGGASLAAETTLNLQAVWRFAPGWSLQAKLNNATDEHIEPARDYQGLGRQAWLVLKWALQP
jgi:vitamin B12 transporter